MCFSTPKIPEPVAAPTPPPPPQQRADEARTNVKVRTRSKRGRMRGVSQFRAPQINVGDEGVGSDSALNQ